MKRLTHWNGKKYCLPQNAWREIAERLSAYENTGLEPEEINALKTAIVKKVVCDSCTDNKACPEYECGEQCVIDRKSDSHQSSFWE